MVDADGDGIHLPVVSVLVLEQATVACAPHKSCGLVDHGTVLTVGEGPHGGVRHSTAVAVARILGSGDGVGEVVFPVDLVHPRPLKEGKAAISLVVIPGTLKAVDITIALVYVDGALQYLGEILRVELGYADGEIGAETLIAIQGAVVIHEQGRIVPAVGTARVDP